MMGGFYMSEISHFKSVLLFVNAEKEDCRNYVWRAEDAIKDMLSPESLEIMYTNNVPEVLKDYDLIITVGGDGTIIRAAHLFPNIPIFGINKGRRGFLANIPPDTIEYGLLQISIGTYNLNVHKFIEGNIGLKESHLAVNDIIVGKADITDSVSLDLYIDEQYISNIICDGIIVSSAFGSTAYNKSLGGPVVHPSCEVMVVKPIAPVNFSNTEIVVPSSSKIEIEGVNRINERCIVGFDGRSSVKELKKGQSVIIGQSDKTFRFVELASNTYLSNLARKLV